MPQFHRFPANPLGLDEDCAEDCGRYSEMLDAAGRCYAAVSSLDSEEVFRCQRFRSFDCVAEIRALPAANKLHGSSVEMIVVYMLPVPTYDLHVAQFFESVVR